MKHFTCIALCAVLGIGFANSKTVTLWETGQAAASGNGEVTEQYGTGLILAPEVFSEVTAGSRLNIDLEVSGWAELYLKNGDKVQIYPSTAINNGKATEVLTNFQLEQIKDFNGFAISASSVMKITKVSVETDAYAGNFANAIWIGAQTFTADWGGIIKFCPLQAAALRAGDELKVYYTKNAESTSVMVNYINTEGKQVDYYPQWTYTADGASFVIPEDFANLLSTNNKGFVVKGASITVSQVDLINDQAEDGVLWSGSQKIDWSSDNAVVIPARKFAQLNATDKIRFAFSTIADAGYYNLKPFVKDEAKTRLSAVDASSNVIGIAEGATYYDISLNAADVTALKQFGMEIQGWGLDMKSVSILHDTSGIENIAVEGNEVVNVYSLSGVLLRQAVAKNCATYNLPAGLYVVGNKKVLVK